MKALPCTIEPDAVGDAMDLMVRDAKLIFGVAGPMAVRLTKDVEVLGAVPAPIRARVTLIVTVEEIGSARQ